MGNSETEDQGVEEEKLLDAKEAVVKSLRAQRLGVIFSIKSMIADGKFFCCVVPVTHELTEELEAAGYTVKSSPSACYIYWRTDDVS